MTKEKGKRPEWNATAVKGLRLHMGMTQQELSRELGTRQQTISEWETGLYAPRGASATLLRMVAERVAFEYRSSADPIEQAREDSEDGPAP